MYCNIKLKFFLIIKSAFDLRLLRKKLNNVYVNELDINIFYWFVRHIYNIKLTNNIKNNLPLSSITAETGHSSSIQIARTIQSIEYDPIVEKVYPISRNNTKTHVNIHNTLNTLVIRNTNTKTNTLISCQQWKRT